MLSLGELNPLYRGWPAAFLEDKLPSKVVRATSSLVIVMGLAAMAAAAFMPLPERISGDFVLVPVEGADPVRASIAGTLERSLVRAGDTVVKGQVLFVVRSEDVAVGRARLDRLTRELAAQEENAPVQERRRALEARAAQVAVERLSADRRQSADRLDTMQKYFGQSKSLASRGMWSSGDLLKDRLALQEVEADRTRLDGQLVRARVEIEELSARHAQERQSEARERTNLEGQVAEARASMHEPEAESDLGPGLYAVRAATDGVILEVGPRQRGAVIDRGELLGRLAATHAALAVELRVPELEAARLAPGQPVKLRLDAYPYARYGTRSATVGWVSPRAEGGFIAVRAELIDRTIVVDGEARALCAGMKGKGNVIVGRRTALDLVLEPLTRLRENVAELRAYDNYQSQPRVREAGSKQ
jgi:multidrug efflux pump subunit AcrA (membrane-fusion protein)